MHKTADFVLKNIHARFQVCTYHSLEVLKTKFGPLRAVFLISEYSSIM